MSSAGALRTQGNEYLRQKKYFDAYRCFSEARDKCPAASKVQLAQIYVQLSAVELVLEKVPEALASATKAIEADPNNFMGYVRRANAYSEMLSWKEAYDDYQTASIMQSTETFFKPRMEVAKKNLAEAGIAIPEPSRMKPVSFNSTAKPAPVEKEPSPRVLPASAQVRDSKYNAQFAEKLMKNMMADKRPPIEEARDLMNKVESMNRKMPNVVPITIDGTIHIVGDTHGQFQDVVALFNRFGMPSSKNPYLFNGDFVDRGSMGIEILLTLFAWKLADPNSIFLNRGNHEQRSMNMLYGFERECIAKYNQQFYEEMSEFFNSLPVGHVINNKVFVVHGGLFTDQTMTIDKIQRFNRFRQPPDSGPMNDMLWSDPMNQRGLAPSPRGVTSTFGPDVTDKFLSLNKLELVVRSHQVQEEGYAVQHSGKCITVFTAPNYMGQLTNKGAICDLTFRGGVIDPPKFMQISAEPIPSNYRPMKYADFSGMFL